MKKLPFIKMNPTEQQAEFAGRFPAETATGQSLSNKYPIFRDAITKLLFSNFKWYGLSEMEANTIEYNLIMTGRVCAIKSKFDIDKKTPDGIFYGVYGTQVNDIQYDFYGYPTKASCSGLNGEIFTAESPDDFEIGFDSSANIYQFGILTTPLYAHVETLAKELDRSYQMWQVAAETRKLGMVFDCKTKRSANLLKSILKKISENNPYVVVDSEIGDEIDTIYSPSNTVGLSEYHDNFINTWAMVMDLLGLENSPSNKKERLVVTEAEMNRSLSRYLGADRLKARKEFAENCNKKFGTNIQVENYLDSIINESENNASIYGDQNGGENNAANENTATGKPE